MNMDAHQLNFKSGMFDGAYALESIMHMNREKVLSEVHRVLKMVLLLVYVIGM